MLTFNTLVKAPQSVSEALDSYSLVHWSNALANVQLFQVCVSVEIHIRIIH